MCRPHISTWRARRRLIGWFRRKTHWEFWPPWAAYIPLIPYFLYLGRKHRSSTLFTAANPGIPSGGFVGECKSRILTNLADVPPFALLSSSFPAEARFQVAKAFMTLHALDFPVVLKPNVGERGSGVAIVVEDRELRSYLHVAMGDTIIQKYVGGLEFGIFYHRHPCEANGHILSITEKRFPSVCGDGKSTIRDLILRDERAVCLARLYLARLTRSIDEVPASGERVPLTQVGSHCRGAIFLNAAHLETDALRFAVDSAAKSHPRFFFGRFDVRASSIADLQAGRFKILELNGVSAEATHVYDPAVSLMEAYRAMFRQWKIAFEIGAANRKTGAKPMQLLDFLHLLRTRRAECDSCPALSASINLSSREYFIEETGY